MSVLSIAARAWLSMPLWLVCLLVMGAFAPAAVGGLTHDNQVSWLIFLVVRLLLLLGLSGSLVTRIVHSGAFMTGDTAPLSECARLVEQEVAMLTWLLFPGVILLALGVFIGEICIFIGAVIASLIDRSGIVSAIIIIVMMLVIFLGVLVFIIRMMMSVWRLTRHSVVGDRLHGDPIVTTSVSSSSPSSSGGDQSTNSLLEDTDDTGDYYAPRVGSGELGDALDVFKPAAFDLTAALTRHGAFWLPAISFVIQVPVFILFVLSQFLGWSLMTDGFLLLFIIIGPLLSSLWSMCLAYYAGRLATTAAVLAGSAQADTSALWARRFAIAVIFLSLWTNIDAGVASYFFNTIPTTALFIRLVGIVVILLSLFSMYMMLRAVRRALVGCPGCGDRHTGVPFGCDCPESGCAPTF